MKLKINIEKKHIYYLAALVIFVFITAIAIAQSSAPNPGHAATEIGEGTIAGTLTVSGGNVGIGTTGPDAKLSIREDAGNAAVNFNRGGTVYGIIGINTVNEMVIQSNTVPMRFSADGSTNTHMRILANGNIGIGTTSPQSPLHVSMVSGTGHLTLERTGVNTGKWTQGVASYYAISEDGTGGPMSGPFRFYIAAGGNVGIGTMGPIGLLDLSGQTSSDIVFSDKQWWGGVSNPRGRIYSAIDSDQWAGSRLTLQSLSGSGSSYSFIDTMSLKNGNVGIGTTNPEQRLDVQGGIRAHAWLETKADNAQTDQKIWQLNTQDGGFYIGTWNDARNAEQLAYQIGRSGYTVTSHNWLINNQYKMKLDSNGNLAINNLAGSGNAYACVNANGQLYRSATACS